MDYKGEPLSDEMARLSKEERAEIYIQNRDERIKKSKALLMEMEEAGEIASAEDVSTKYGCHYDKGDGFSKGNIYRLIYLGDIESIRMCPRCGSLDVNARQIGYFRTWDSGQAICMDCGWEVENVNVYVYIRELQLVKDYHVYCDALAN